MPFVHSPYRHTSCLVPSVCFRLSVEQLDFLYPSKIYPPTKPELDKRGSDDEQVTLTGALDMEASEHLEGHEQRPIDSSLGDLPAPFCRRCAGC